MKENKFVNDFTDGLKSYYKNISHYKIRNKEEEKEIFIKAKLEGDEEAKNLIITSNLKFVFDIAKSYKGCGVPMDELIAEGNMGLLKAYERFDIERDVKFFSYAVWWIKCYIRECIANKGIVDTYETSSDEMEMGDSIELNSMKEDDDYNEDQSSLFDFSDESDDEVNNQDAKAALVERLLSVLDKREREIMECYFGLGENEKPMNFDECGQKFNLSSERVRQIHIKSLLKLRAEALILV